MKKVLCFLLVLVLLGTSLLGVTAYSLIKESDNVTFTLVDEWGDRRSLQGISAEMSFSLYERQFWNVKLIPFGEITTEYDYDTFYSRNRSARTFYGISSPHISIMGLKNHNSALNQLIEELKADAKNPGDIRKSKIKFRDFFEYYPVILDIYLPGITVEWMDSTGFYEKGEFAFSGITPSRGNGLIKALNDYFRIPVSEEDCREITIFSGSGNSFSYQTSYERSFSFNFIDTTTDSCIYFSFNNEINDGHRELREIVDTSLIPGGYGIYALPYTENDINYKELKTVYSVPSDATVETLSVSEERNELYLGLHENDKFVFHIIDMNTMTDKTAIELFDYTCEDFIRVSENEDFFVFIKNDVDFNVVSRNSDGIWISSLKGVMPSETIPGREYFSYKSRFGFDGERLVVWVIEDPDFGKGERMTIEPDFMVFTRDGLSYYGKWVCSLSDPVSGVIRGSVICNAWKVIIE